MLLSRKLPLAAALMTLISVGVASVAAIWLASISLETAAYEKLDAVADGRRDQIEIHLKNIEKDLVAVSRREDVAQATNLFASAWSEIGKDQKSELQKRYIKDNPNPLGEKHLLNKANANDAYDVVHEKYHPRFRELLEAGAYYDIFIISPEGDIIYSVFKELDYATNLNSGEWKDTDLAKLYKDVMKSGNASDVVFEDYHPYGPSNGAAASFIGKVIVENGQKIGVLAFQMPTQSIADIVHNRTGLGETGETLLLNKEGYLIIDSKFSETDDSLKTKIDYPGIQSISHDEITNGFIDTYRDMYAEIALVKVDFNDANWVVAAILEQDEALAGITTMRNSVIVAALVLVLGTLAIALWFSRTITKPIDGLVHNMTELANGNTDIKLADKANDTEIGRMAAAVGIFRDAAIEKTSLEEKSEALRQENENEATKRSNERERETQKIQSAVSALAQGLDRLAIGDLTTSIDNKFDGELDSLRVNFNKSVAQLRKTLQRISQSTVSIDDNSREMKIAADDLARRTEQQAASLEQTSAALEEITSTVKEASDQTKDAAKMANAAMEDTNKSSAVVNDAVMAMGGIESASSEIANIINVIDEIAFQTNLLALNAGVEAARAGEAGKGFAVVAQEVRELAGRSAEAAKDIKGLIAKSTTEVNNGVSLVKATGEALASISEHVSKITGTIGSIANASTEQLTAITEVNTAIGQMDQVTQQNAAMVEESTAVTHKMAEDAEMLAAAVNEFQIEINQRQDYSKVA
jgi:methyl-accepting chemotaxis protein